MSNRITGRSVGGTPWHVGYAIKDEDDPRRHKSKCIHYASKTKYCDFIFSKCNGSAHCPHYEERDEESR